MITSEHFIEAGWEEEYTLDHRADIDNVFITTFVFNKYPIEYVAYYDKDKVEIWKTEVYDEHSGNFTAEKRYEGIISTTQELLEVMTLLNITR